MEVDADGAALRIRTFADNLRRSHLTPFHAPDTPARQGLPALRSGGLGVFRSDNAIRQHGVFQAIKGLNVVLGQPGAAPFRAEDLLQGLRWDVFDVQSGKWFSLMRRHGSYEIGGSSPLAPAFEDEGVASTSVVQDPNAAANDSSTDLFLGEILARFTGDSMAAPRPGKTLDTDPAGRSDRHRAARRPELPPDPDVHAGSRVAAAAPVRALLPGPGAGRVPRRDGGRARRTGAG